MTTDHGHEVYFENSGGLPRSGEIPRIETTKKITESVENYLCGVNSLACNYIINLEEYNDAAECGFNCVPPSLLSPH